MKLLILYHAAFTHTQTIYDYLSSFARYGGFDVDYFNIDQSGASFKFDAYDAVFVNYCVVSQVRYDRVSPYLYRTVINPLRAYGGAKVVSIQDEYDFTDKVKRFLAEINPDLILTCVPQEFVGEIYHGIDAEFMTVLTGYVDPSMVSPDPVPLRDRPIPLGYRGRELPYRTGSLGRHKALVGRIFKERCEARGVACDIAVDEKSRFGGSAWLDFVRSCRVMLGSPSGSNVFDFDGSLHRRVAEVYHSGRMRYEDVEDIVEARARSWDMGQIAPRLFEAVASRTALALVRGSYSGLLTPYENYVPIEPDYSNVDEVIDAIQDLDSMQAMADRTFDQVVLSRGNTYAGFVDKVCGRISSIVAAKDFKPAALSWLSVTKEPLGHDPYLISRMNAYLELVQGVLDGTLEKMKHPEDEGLLFMKFSQPR